MSLTSRCGYLFVSRSCRPRSSSPLCRISMPGGPLARHNDEDVVSRRCDCGCGFDYDDDGRKRVLFMPLWSPWAWYGRSCLRQIRSLGGGRCWTVSVRMVAGIIILKAHYQSYEAARKVFWVSHCPYAVLSSATVCDIAELVRWSRPCRWIAAAYQRRWLSYKLLVNMMLLLRSLYQSISSCCRRGEEVCLDMVTGAWLAGGGVFGLTS